MKVFGAVSAAVLIVLLLSTVSFAFPLTPNPAWTTGSICNKSNPDYLEDRYPEKIAYCQRNVSYETKTKIYDMYHIPANCRYRYTIDHFIPLSIGGDNSEKNLWPEHKLVKSTRQHLEEEVFEQVQQGKISQKDAIDIMIKAKTTLKTAPQGSSPCDKIDAVFLF